MFTAKGKVKVVGQLEKISDSFHKRKLVLEIDGKFPQFVEFEFTQDRVAKLDGLKVGQDVSVDFYLRGREWSKDGQTKYFTSLDGFNVSSGISEAVKKIDNRFPEDESSDLPF